jgi:hypothetical protein
MIGEREAATRRLNTALVEQEGLREGWRAAIGTPDEVGAYVLLRVTGEEIAALQAWLNEPSDDGDAAGGRIWVNGREFGGRGARYHGLEDSHD